MPGRHWTDDEKRRALELHDLGHSIREIAAQIGRSRSGVNNKLAGLLYLRRVLDPEGGDRE